MVETAPGSGIWLHFDTKPTLKPQDSDHTTKIYEFAGERRSIPGMALQRLKLVARRDCFS